MATVDPYARTPPKTDTPLVHSRSLSTASNITLFTGTTHSHTTEPLLHATTPQTVRYDDQPDHIPTDGDESIGRLPCETPLVIHGNPTNEAEMLGSWARNRRTLIRWRWKWLKFGLRAALCEFSPNLANIRHCRSWSPSYFLCESRAHYLLVL
jgi:hypothetical protein